MHRWSLHRYVKAPPREIDRHWKRFESNMIVWRNKNWIGRILGTQGDTLDDIIDTFPATVNTPEILIPIAEQDKAPLMKKILRNADFSSGKLNTMDGIRVDFAEGWGLLRASNTNSVLTARFEAESEQALEMIMSEFREQVALIDPSIELNF